MSTSAVFTYREQRGENRKADAPGRNLGDHVDHGRCLEKGDRFIFYAFLPIRLNK